MNMPYTPIHVTLELDKERRPDPRVLAAARGAVPDRHRLRHRIGVACIKLGQWIEGDRRELADGTA